MRFTIRILLPLCFLALALPSFGQVSANANQGGQLTLGLNAGWSYQSSDIRTNFDGFGLGATLAKNLYYRPGAALSFDARGRLLFARQYGYDPFRNADIEFNQALNGSSSLDYLNYPTNLNEPEGFVFQNHQTTLGELSLEGVFTLNRLKEQSNIIASLYGGIGVDWYRTKIDQSGPGGAYYEGYAGIDENAPTSAILRDLRNTVLDGDFETLADGYNNAGKVDFMPSVGVEFGYQFTPNFSITAGHRLTFAGNDLLDGQQWENANNDLYHYTSLGLNWTVGRRAAARGKAPEITLTEPRSNPFRTLSVNGVVRARIVRVNSAADVTCTVNGRSVPFQLINDNFYLSFYLDPGRNEVLIQATNPYGSDAKRVVILLEGNDVIVNPPNSQPRPEVVITSPSGPRYSTQESRQVVRATIRNVASKNDVQLLVNGQSLRSFTYDPNRDQFVTTINLSAGQTEVRIIGENAYGSDEDRLTIIRENLARQPQVDIYQPSQNPFETNNPRQSVRANLKNVNSRSYLEVTVNGRKVSNWQYSSGRVTVNLDLNAGNNTIRIEANTPDGYASDETRLIYTVSGPSQRPPTINITRPIEPTVTVEAESYSLRANTENIDRKSQVDFTVNGQRVTNFGFNTKTGQISANLKLRTGSNNVRITVTNGDGTAQDAANIRYVPPIQSSQPPEVTIQSPANNSVVENNRVNLRAIAKYVTRKQDVKVTLNGQNVSGFSFQPVSGSISATLTLRTGSNTIIVRGTNEDGTDQDQIQIRYQQSNPPSVKFTRPSGSSTNSTAPTYQVKAEVKGVSSKSQVKFTINGTQSNSFTLTGTQFTANISLREGDNRLVLKATNSDGSAEDNVLIRHTPKSPPTVKITKPSNGTQTTTPQTNLEAKVTGVSSKAEVTVLINGRTTNAYTLSGGKVRANVALRSGQNTLTVKVNNAQGSDQDQVTVRYTQKSPPTVKITKPRNGSTVGKSAISVEATTTNITAKSQVEFILNGRKLTSFTYSNQTIKANVRLREGKNTILIKVNNSDGNDSDQISVTYEVATPKPIVDFTTPQRAGGKVSKAGYTLKAKIQHVTSKEKITLRINGRSNPNFTFDSKTGTLSARVTLKKGTNQLQITATNSAGSGQDNTTVIFEGGAPPITGVDKPTVEITNVSQPATNPFDPNAAATSITAKTTKITRKSQIKITVNGTNVTDFEFNANKQEIKADIALQRGNNTIKVKVTNRAGSAEDTSNVEF